MLIDSQIWIYFIDPNSPENNHVKLCLEGTNEDGILFRENIMINPVIPMEVAHAIFGNPKLDINLSYDTITSLFHFDHIDFKIIDQETLSDGLNILAKYRKRGIGGRDALVMATMMKFNNKTIVTNDKNLLGLTELQRIDPIFDPPMILEIGENFDYTEFQRIYKENYPQK